MQENATYGYTGPNQTRTSQAGHFYFGTVLLLLNKKLGLKNVLF